MASAPTVSTLSSTGDHWTPRRTSNYNNDELGPSDEPRKRPSRPTSCFSNAWFCCIGFLFHFYHYTRLVLLHRFPLLFLPLAGCFFCIYRVQRKSNHPKIYSLFPLRYHQSPHVCSHILRGGTFLLFSCRALSVISQVQRSGTRAPIPKNLSPKDVYREDGRVGS